MPTSKSKNNSKILPRIGITLGDPTGIGAEITAKALDNLSIRKLGQFTIIGSTPVISKFFPRNYPNVSFIASDSSTGLILGRPNKASGAASLKYLDIGIDLLKKGAVDSLVTAPVSKEEICKSTSGFKGHTEYLAEAFKAKQVGMFFITPKLKVLIATRHIPISEVAEAISQKNIYENIVLIDSALKTLFKLKNPNIGICGLNPHAGEGGNIGRDEILKIIPAIKKAQKNNIKALGPFAADTFFQPDKLKNFDAVLAMYHDQGLIPIKTLYFDTLVNLTIGLPVIRTSPAHGTAFNIAGQNKANPGSMIEAIKLAATLS